ncbi:MAG TPA: dTMP kinase [Hyphomonadaceae bacterium]|nr:dTMP kinase [Hyphomonadaceae bacterium]
MAAKGRFITLEGGEGVGKSTLAASLASKLGSRGLKVVRTREPGGSPGAEALRRLILTPPPELDAWGPVTEALMFYAARRDHLDKLIRPALDAGSWVICDRFSDSTRAYQAAAGGAVREEIEALERIVVGNRGPDLTLVLDLPLTAARARMTARATEDDAIESRGPEYHERVRQAFLDIARANPQRCAVLDASMAPEDVADAAVKLIDQRLGAA